MKCGYKTVVGIIFIVLFLFSLSLSLSSSSENKQLQILVVNKDMAIIDEIQEGEEFGVYVVDSNDPTQYPLSDLTIVFNGEEHYVDENNPDTYPICYLIAPEVNEDTSMQITAIKSGYANAYQTITILNIKKLMIFPASIDIEAGKLLEITVRDEDGNPISNAEVNFTVPGVKALTIFTDENGVAEFNVPSVEKETSLFITASKIGYKSVSIQGSIRGDNASLLPNYLLPIIGAVGILLSIFAGIIRHAHRNSDLGRIERRRGMRVGSENIPPPSLGRRRAMPKENKEVKEAVRIEEIVVGPPDISIGEKPVKVEDENRATVKPKPVQKQVKRVDTKPDTWVLGTDSIRAKIDEKIGGSSSSKIAVTKWFTGREDVIAKVDEKIKQYDRRKKKHSKSEKD